MRYQRRVALTLIELLVVLAIMAVLIGLLLVAVQKVRQTAVRMEGVNNQRQILLASHNFAQDHGGLPSIDGNDASPNSGKAYLFALLPYIEGGWLYRELNDPLSTLDRRTIQIKTYFNPMDPSVASEYPIKQKATIYCSYALNGQALYGTPRLETTFRDGTSNTIALAERYWFCSPVTIIWTHRDPQPLSGVFQPPVFASSNPLFRTFEGQGPVDHNYPITEGDPPVSRGRYPGTFQVAPRFLKAPNIPQDQICDPGLTQTPNPSGMSVAMADGSVRLLGKGMAESVYWALVTPAGGEVVLDP
jgi:type II secretory pathway pseudopilin PulG